MKSFLQFVGAATLTLALVFGLGRAVYAAADCGCRGTCAGPGCACDAKPGLENPTYAEFRTSIEGGGTGTLFVGVPARAVAGPRCSVKSRFGDLDDGEYHCYRDERGKPVLVPVPPPLPMAGPPTLGTVIQGNCPTCPTCPGGRCPAPGVIFRR